MSMTIRKSASALAAVLVISLSMQANVAWSGATLDAIKERGELKCGVASFFLKSEVNGIGQNKSGLDRLICKSIAAAVLGDVKRAKFSAVSASLRFKALQAGDFDVLIRGTTWTMTRDAALGLHFAGVNFYDGQGFIVRSDLGVRSILEMKDAKVCIETNTTSAANFLDYAELHNFKYQPIVFRSHKEARAGFLAGRCDI